MPFRPILSAIGMPLYKFAKFLVPRMNSIKSNEFTIIETFCFVKEIVEQDRSPVIFNKVLYEQKDGVAMGSPLGPILANPFLCFYEKKCPPEFMPVFIEDILMFLFYSNQLIISKKFVTTLILVNRICPFHTRKKKMVKYCF